MMYPMLYLKSGKEQSLQRFHPWIFSGAVKRVDGDSNDGDVVKVVSAKGEFLALGHYQPGSITVRVISFEQCEIDRDFWRQKLIRALALRKNVGLYPNPKTNIFRFIHGEGDNLPGLIVDVYGTTAVMQAHSTGMAKIKGLLAELIVEVFGGTISSVYYKSTGTLSRNSTDTTPDGYLLGGASNTELLEHGNAFNVSWEEGQKTGFFIDQRENRNLLSQYCKNANVLNTFCYTGGFSVYAARGGAKSVVSVDSSQKAVELTSQNMLSNFGENSSHRAICADVFDFFRDNPDELYDVIILDPPAFAKHRGALRNALQAYKRLNTIAMHRLKPGGLLFTFSCSQVVNRENFRNSVFSASVIANKNVKILHQLSQPADHPINIYHPEGEYLKGLVLYVE